MWGASMVSMRSSLNRQRGIVHLAASLGLALFTRSAVARAVPSLPLQSQLPEHSERVARISVLAILPSNSCDPPNVAGVAGGATGGAFGGFLVWELAKAFSDGGPQRNAVRNRFIFGGAAAGALFTLLRPVLRIDCHDIRPWLLPGAYDSVRTDVKWLHPSAIGSTPDKKH